MSDDYVEPPPRGGELPKRPAENPYAKYSNGNPYAQYAQAGSEPAAKVEQPSIADSLWQGFLHGAGNAVAGGRQLAARIPGMSSVTGETPQQADEAARQRQREYMGPFAPGPGQVMTPARANPRSAGIGEFAGEAAVTAPLLAIPGGGGVLPRMASGALQGGLAGGMQPTSGGRDFWAEKGKQIGVGAAAGGAMGAAGGVLAPPLSQDAQALAARGMRASQLTPGQRMGMQAGEQTLAHFPILHGYIRGIGERSVGEFDRAAFRQALEPIGAVMPRAVQPGHDMMAFSQRAVSDAYDRLLPQLQPLDRQITEQAIRSNPQLMTTMSEMSGDHLRRFEAMIDNHLARFDQGVMDGQSFKRAESYLSSRANSLIGTNDNELGLAVRQLNAIMRGELANQNPTLAPALNNINASWAMLQTLRGAGTRRATSEGTFTPADLLAATRTSDPSANHRLFANGDALFQDFAETANRVMGRQPGASMPHVSLGNVATGAAGRIPYGMLDFSQRHPGLGNTLRYGAPAAGGEAGESVTPRERMPRVPTAGG